MFSLHSNRLWLREQARLVHRRKVGFERRSWGYLAERLARCLFARYSPTQHSTAQHNTTQSIYDLTFRTALRAVPTAIERTTMRCAQTKGQASRCHGSHDIETATGTATERQKERETGRQGDNHAGRHTPGIPCRWANTEHHSAFQTCANMYAYIYT